MAARNANSIALTVIRVALGVLFLRRGLAGVRGEGPDADATEAVVRASVEGLASPLRAWGEGVLLKNPEALVLIVGWGCVALGLLLLFGAFVRGAGWLAAFVALNGAIYGSPGTGPGYVLAAICCAACAFGGAGDSAGLDAVLASGRRGRGKGKGSFLD